MQSLTTPSTSSSSEDVKTHPPASKTRCFGGFQERLNPFGRTGLDETNYTLDTSSDAKAEPDFLTNFSKRKSTACETELELSEYIPHEQVRDTPMRKPSLLAGLTPSGQRNFEVIVLDEDPPEEVEYLGKRQPDQTLPDLNVIINDELADKKMTLEFEQPSPELNSSGSRSSGVFCKLGHRLGSYSECQTCKSVYLNICRFASERGGCLVSEHLRLEVSLSCEHGHVWSVSYKKAQKSWCRECKSKRKQLIKDLLEQETVKKNQERMLKQEKMLKESRERMHIGENIQKEQSIF